MSRAHLDVYHLPSSGLDAQHPVWWGNTLALCVETTILTLLLVSDFYLRKNFSPWPPPRAFTGPPPIAPVPDLGFATADAVVLVASCIPMAWIDRVARSRARAEVATEERPERPIPPHGGFRPRSFTAPVLTFLLLTLLGGLSFYFRFHEFRQLHVKWYDNAYGSIVWTLLGTHLTYVIMSIVEVALLAIWTWQSGLTTKFALDTTLAAASWYWTVAVWLVIYLVVFWIPRWMGT